MNAVDTNVLLYAVDEDEPAKRKRAREFLRQLGRTDEPLLMWQVLLRHGQSGEPVCGCLTRLAGVCRFTVMTGDIPWALMEQVYSHRELLAV